MHLPDQKIALRNHGQKNTFIFLHMDSMNRKSI
nr:hypothetical protein [Klebsiella quasipneumoniae]